MCVFGARSFDLCQPHLICDGVADINFGELAALGRRYYIIDVDNTLAPHYSEEVNPEAAIALALARERKQLAGLCLLSNVGLPVIHRARAHRVARIAHQLGADGYVCAYHPHQKPKSDSFWEALARMPGATTGNCVVVGDQLFTDVKGGNRLSMYTVWVRKPLGGDHWITWPKRVMELVVRQRLGIM